MKSDRMDWRARSVLVTGGTGSFGSRFVERMVSTYHPRRLVVFSRDELKQSQLAARVQDPSLRFFIGDVRDRDRLQRAMHGIDVVIHAAALKQVPACEYNPFEAVKTNVLGANNVIEAAIDQGVEHVVALSTDKAVNPVNVYGATKLCAEKMFVQGNSYAGGLKTRMAVVRYGNVVGSRGSVIPLFLDQRDGGELTITDERMTRFWLTLDEGVDFVVRAVERMQGGEIFVPKIPSMRVIDLARAIAPDASLRVVGVRPGEKLHEVLLSADEARHSVDVDGMYVVQPVYAGWSYTTPAGAKALPADFAFTSDTNTAWCSGEELKRMVEA
jgi:UDP-N-acetylglucosamine 4,6-dehydratase/5-epimerase